MGKMIAAAVACLLVLAGCDMRPRLQFDRGAFERARSDWEAQGLTCYVFEINQFGGSGPNPLVRVTVVGGEMVNAELLADGWLGDRDWDAYVDSIRENFGTVPDIFDYIWRRYQSIRASMGNTRRGSFVFIDVEYNAEYRFPQQFSVSQPTGMEGRGFWTTRLRSFEPMR